MTDSPIREPEALGLDRARWRRVDDLLARWAGRGLVPAAARVVGRPDGMIAPRGFGRQHPDGEDPLRPDALFLVASLTKPVTAAAVVLLAERGLVGLDDRVAEYVPDFAQRGKAEVRLRHLLTHTSGLPDMPPENEALRAAHRPPSAFVEATCRRPLLFEPGTRVSYQSMGFALLAEVVHQVSGSTPAEFLRAEVFEPLGLRDTSLGLRPEMAGRVAAIRLGAGRPATDWDWNSAYWLGFGAPWGGLITSPGDYARFCRLMLGGGPRVLSPAAVRALTTHQRAGMPHVPEEERRCRPWGLGWRLNWPGHSANFGDLLGPRTFGHWGATGTLAWIDPDAGAFFLLFTTQPQGDDGRFLARASNAVAAALDGNG